MLAAAILHALAHLCGGAACCFTMFMISSGVLSGSPFLACRQDASRVAPVRHAGRWQGPLPY
jgi:hypothetical protein